MISFIYLSLRRDLKHNYNDLNQIKMETKQVKSNAVNTIISKSMNAVSNPNEGTIRLSDIQVSAGVKRVTKKAKDLSESLKGILISYRESITLVPAEKGNEKIASYNRAVREHRAALGADATALLLNTRVAVKYLAKVLPNVEGVFVDEMVVYSESLDRDGKIKVTDTRSEAVMLGVTIIADNGRQRIYNPIEDVIVDKNGLKKYKGYKHIKKYTHKLIEKFIDYAVNQWIADGRPSK